ncbi:hypothetical protein [Microbacterium sp. G2-8]|uniref:hypothetical protein n=1 Tax=Microbacterium sp. G2-8 TaxID=2842454 RepID=UPI001C89FCC7|nr:hypothetical protein [Microbacterium sp. G2-8]
MGASAFSAISIGAAAALALALAAVGAGSVEAQRLSGVADAAAFAAADVLAGYATGDACGRAGEVATAQGATVRMCELSGRTATIEVAGDYAGIPVVATARAGPPPDGASSREDPPS